MNIEAKQEIQKLRLKFNLTQEQFAEKCGVSRQAVAKWEKGVLVIIGSSVFFVFSSEIITAPFFIEHLSFLPYVMNDVLLQLLCI